MSKETTLGEIANIITGPFGTQLHMEDYVDEGIPVIMPQNIDNRCVNENNIARINQTDYKRLIRYSTKKNDIIFARRGNVEKHAFIISDNLALCGTGCFRVRVTSPNVYPLYLSFYLDRPESKSWLSSHAIGTNMPNLNTGILSAVPILLPNLENQIKIANFLQNIEKKIQYNNSINDNLQQIAKTIYDYWFTQFDFPDENGKPYRSSGGKMVWNEQLKREIPAGWSVINVQDISNVTWGQCPDGKNILPKSETSKDVIDYCSGAGDMKNGFVVSCKAKTNASKRMAHKNDILVSVAGKIGDMCVVDHDISLGRAAMAYSAKNKNELMFIFLLLNQMNKKMITISSGSIQKVINSEHINELNFAYNSQIVNKWSKLYNKVFYQLIHISHEIDELTSLRDWLLPMLMNGQATIAD